MRTWLVLLAGMIVWTIHFFALWTVGSVVLSVPVARVIVATLTIACFLADAGLLMVLVRKRAGDELEKWVRSLGLLGVGLSLVAVTWQGLPALVTR